MVEFNREINTEAKIKRGRLWKFLSFLSFVLIIILIIVLYRGYQETLKMVNNSYNSGIQIGTQQGINIGLSRCPSCPTCTTTTCPVCESPNQTVLNLAQEQTRTSNIILFNGTHIVSLPLNKLCAKLENVTG